MKIDRDGYLFSLILLFLSAFLFYTFYLTLSYIALAFFIVFIILSVFTLSFFRDPDRKAPENNKAALSAADGVVADVSEVEAHGFENRKALRIAVLMNIFNVHVNRSPVSGKVIKTEFRPGKKLSVFGSHAEYENEYGDTDIESPGGLVRIKQIAGLIARRIVTRVSEGDVLKRGERIGLIRFGSRVDVFLPLTYKSEVQKGDHVRAGETVIAYLGENK
jgi:phosphatidylserine decarboxylase